MTTGALNRAEEAIKNGVASVDDVLDTYGPSIVRNGRLPELVQLCEASPGGRDSVARWIERTDFENGVPPGTEVDPLDGVDLVNLADFLEDPDAFSPPSIIARGVAYEGQVTLMYGDPKGGKSTTAIGLGAAVSSGSRWMAHPTEEGPVLYLAAEGDRNQLLRRHYEFGASEENVDVVVPGRDPIGELQSLMDYRDYRLVVIDTLGKWMAPLEVDRWKQSDVDTVLTPLERIVRESGAALVALHHANSEGKPIDSTGFAAWADVLRRIEDGQNERERVVTGRARFRVPDLRFQLFEDEDGSDLVPVDPNRGPDEEIIDFIDAHPDCSKSAIREGVSGSRERIDDRLKHLISEGIVDRDTSGRAHTHQIAENPQRHGLATVRHGSRHGNAGNGGDNVAEAVPPTHKGGGPSATVAEPADSAKRCECGNRIGPSAEQCGGCRREEAS